jgi:hypothetical protein
MSTHTNYKDFSNSCDLPQYKNGKKVGEVITVTADDEFILDQKRHLAETLIEELIEKLNRQELQRLIECWHESLPKHERSIAAISQAYKIR